MMGFDRDFVTFHDIPSSIFKLCSSKVALQIKYQIRVDGH